MSLRSRLLIATGIAVLVGLVVVDSLTYVLVSRSQLSQVDDALERAHSPVEELANGDPSNWPIIPEIAPGLFVAIVDPSGEVLFVSHARRSGDDPLVGDLTRIDVRSRNQTVTVANGDGLRLHTDRLDNGSTLLVGQSLHEIEETQGRLLVALLAASAAALAAILAIAWWLIRIGLRPLTRVQQSAAAIDDDDLGDSRVPGDDQPTEVGQLANTLNAMLDRLDTARSERETSMRDLQASEARMRQFVADASHELRTPIAATAAYAELFDKGARDHPDDLERSMTGIRAETARMAGLVDDLLLLARLDETRPQENAEVDLTEVMLAALDTARALEPDRIWKLHMPEVVTVRGDGPRLRQVVDNLISNIRTHTPADAEAKMSLTSTPETATLTVSDTGRGVDNAALAHLTDRFFRVNESRTRTAGGNGLGLAITQSIIQAHGGTIAMSHNDPHGLRATVTLPRT